LIPDQCIVLYNESQLITPDQLETSMLSVWKPNQFRAQRSVRMVSVPNLSTEKTGGMTNSEVSHGALVAWWSAARRASVPSPTAKEPGGCARARHMALTLAHLLVAECLISVTAVGGRTGCKGLVDAHGFCGTVGAADVAILGPAVQVASVASVIPQHDLAADVPRADPVVRQRGGEQRIAGEALGFR